MQITSAWQRSASMKTTLKDWRKVHRKLKRLRGLDEHEKVLYARSLAATPDERWQMNVTFLRSLGLWGQFLAEKIRFQLIGMSAAVIQGVPVATFDVDLWLDLPARQYMRAVNLALAQGAKMARNTVVELADGTLVNFIYEVTGLKDFATELRKARKLKFHGLTVPVMPLELIRKSKAAVMRPKDPAHIHYIEETLRLLRAKNRAVKRQ